VTTNDRMPAQVRDTSILLVSAAAAALVMTVAGLVAWRHVAVAGPAYTQALVAAGADPDGLPKNLSERLGYDAVIAGGLAVVTGWLAWSIRFPVRWAQVMTWVAAIGAWAALGCGLAAPAEPAGHDDSLPAAVDRLAQDLLHSWYPDLHSILVYGALAALTAASVQLLRESAQEFYRPVKGDDSSWGSFITKYDQG
jgi:hypothetical protein